MNAARAKAGTICGDISYRGCVSFSTGKAEKGLRNSLTYKLQVHKRETVTKLCSFGETCLRDYRPAKPCPRGFPGRCIFVFHATRSGMKGAMIGPNSVWPDPVCSLPLSKESRCRSAHFRVHPPQTNPNPPSNHGSPAPCPALLCPKHHRTCTRRTSVRPNRARP